MFLRYENKIYLIATWSPPEHKPREKDVFQKVNMIENNSQAHRHSIGSSYLRLESHIYTTTLINSHTARGSLVLTLRYSTADIHKRTRIHHTHAGFLYVLRISHSHTHESSYTRRLAHTICQIDESGCRLGSRLKLLP